MRAWLTCLLVLLALPAMADDTDLLGGLPGAPPPAQPGTATPAKPGEPAKPEVPAAPTLNGLWAARTDDGVKHVLGIYGQQRFIYHDSRGDVAAGDLAVDGPSLRLTSQQVERVFVFELNGDTLRLVPDAGDKPVPLGDLAKLPPHGSQALVWRRNGAAPAEAVPPETEADLLGEYRFAPLPDRVETLRFLPGGKFRYTGPNDLLVEGRYQLRDGALELTDGQVTRRLAASVGFSGEGWELRLTRLPDDCPRPASDLADVPPSLRPEAVYLRALAPVKPDDLAGRYEATEGNVRYRLTFAPNGELRFSQGEGGLVPCRYALDGATLTISLTDELGSVESRRFLVQPFPGGLLLLRTDSGVEGGTRVLRQLPPAAKALARYSVY